MPNLLYPYLIGVVATVVVSIAALISFIVAQFRAQSYERLRMRLPLATRYDDLHLRVQDLQNERDQLAEDLASAHQVIDEKDKAQKWLEDKQEAIEQIKAETKDMEAREQQFVEKSAELADLQQALDDESRQLRLIESEQARIKDDIAALKKSCKEHEARRDETKGEIERLRAQRNTADEELAAVKKEAASLQAKVAGLQAKADSLKDEIDELTRKRDALNKSLTTLNAEAETARLETASAKEALSGLTSRVESAKSQLEDLKETMKVHAPGGGTTAEAISELWLPAIPKDEYSPARKAQTESASLKAVEDYLRDHELIFARRTVYAFHTALKTALDTPLLVLAGISGTGKSLLPRRYAEAMGMHFLSVPVQPRWDGPQDLAGFYNYLEGRYKATDFIRALIQFDEHSADWAPKEYEEWLDDRLLVVLLDEMNLARVEYYFSEFLSRLETRRDIKPDNASDRLKASLPLEVGDFRADDSDNRPQVYVDNNVMFVGTMNEDESTMSLSDKVIDRAAVMQFGKPESFAGREHGGEPKRASTYLSKATWTDWISDGENRQTPKIARSVIQRLNAALSEIGRPFGYRSSDAMEAYVRQYPTQNEEGHRDALADQIEQRIMPRLRGIDVNEDHASSALDEILSTVDELGDRELHDAIDKARNAHSGQLFQWAGVVRSAE